MEGTYLPRQYRAKIVNEIRNTHFELGKGKVEFLTTNNQNYKGLPGSLAVSKNNVNESHVHCLADSKERNQTEFASKYRSHTEESRIKPLKPVPYLTVGNSTGSYVTTASKAFQKYSEQGVKPQKISVSVSRNHHFDIGSGDKIDYVSMMKKEQKMEKGKHSFATDKEIKEKYTKTPNFNEKSGSFVSTTYKVYKEHRPQSPNFIRKIDYSHIEFANIKQEHSTTAQVFYSPKKKPENSSLPKEKLDHLKSSHLNFGTSSSSYAVSSTLHPPENTSYKIVKSSNSPTSINLSQNHTKSFETDYSSNFVPRAKSELRAQIQRNPENYSQIVLGEESHKMTTQARSTFKSQHESPCKLPPQTEKLLKSSHFTLGSDYSAPSPVSLDYKPPTQSFSPSPSLKSGYKKMQESHWEFGKFPTKIKSSVQKEFQWRGSPVKINLNSAELRKSNFNVGCDKDRWKSNYNTAFSWVQPVPDTNYKISLMN